MTPSTAVGWPVTDGNAPGWAMIPTIVTGLDTGDVVGTVLPLVEAHLEFVAHLQVQPLGGVESDDRIADGIRGRADGPRAP